jgi:hypothetical protein
MTGGLSPAHQGYQYQDLVTAYFLARSIVEQFDEVTVDRKRYEGDRFDDIEIRADSGLIRRQFKYSNDAERTFEREDLTTTRKELRIDQLVQCYVSAGTSKANEHRLCTTWSAPTDPAFKALLEDVSVESSFPEHPTKLYRLRGDLIWPDGGAFSWQPRQRKRQKPASQPVSISRQDFLEFAEHFVIELECPSISGDLTNPGVLEGLLLHLLTENIGVGQYPNRDRNPLDVAGSLIQMVSQARAGQKTLKPSEVVANLRLRTDYGRVAQQFPLEESVLVNRTSLLDTLTGEIESEKVVVFTGAPGSGKSWTLTCLAEELKKAGHLVARHYCYLEPGDPEIQRRITSDVLFANLIYDLISSKPSLGEQHRPLYSSGPRELENILEQAAESSEAALVVLIVDGIDHISRVLVESRSLAPEDTDIVQRLATLNLPDGVHLVIGSQPGNHLTPLSARGKSITIPDWNLAETTNLAKRLGILDLLRRAGFENIEEKFATLLHERSEGNPLYATFLCRELSAKLKARDAVEPIAFLQEAPTLEGNISRYYDHLLRTASSGSVSAVVADILGLVDFGITRQELQEILGSAISSRIPNAFEHLSPIFKQVTTQGGVRIYHESFRRFITERLRAQGVLIADVISPVIDWLRRRGFYKDSKAYRFLLPCLRRAGRKKDILNLIEFDFVSRSIETGHPRSALQANLMLAIEVAAEELDWVCLVRFSELHRSIYTCYEEKLRDLELYKLYGQTFGEVFGMDVLVERLLFDGRPTLPAKPGLLLCSLCDDAGQTPPWSEYLELEKKNTEEDNSSDSDWMQVVIARFHGLLRIHGAEAMCRRLSDWLIDAEAPPVDYLRGILQRLTQFGGTDALEHLLAQSHITDEIASIIRVELAKVLEADAKPQQTLEMATYALQSSTSIELAAECLSLGVEPTEVANHFPNLAEIVTEFDPARRFFEEEPVRHWIAALRIAAAANPKLLTEVKERLEGGSWYQNWLRFVICLSEAEVRAKLNLAEAQADLLKAVELLASDTHPFKGKPRAIDLYAIRKVIHESISRALRLLHGIEQWDLVLSHLSKISVETNGYEKSSIGPLAPEVLVELLLPYAWNHSLHESTHRIIRYLVEKIEEIGRFYEVHATFEIYLIQSLIAGKKLNEACSRWQSVAIYLCAYGFRKDVTISELLGSLPALGRVDLQRTRDAIKVVQPLVNEVFEHTERVEYVHGSWYAALCKVDAVAGLALLARSLVLNGGVIDWRLEDGLGDAIDATKSTGNPIILAFLQATQPFDGQTDSAEERLSVIERLFKVDPSIGQHHFQLLAGQIQGDSKNFNPDAWEKLQDFADVHNLYLPSGQGVVGSEEAGHHRTSATNRKSSIWREVVPPVFLPNAAPLDVMKGLHDFSSQFSFRKGDCSGFINAFGYRLVELLDAGAEDEAIRLIHYFSREYYFYEDAVLLAELGQGLERHGYQHIAAIIFVLAYCYSRGGNGYLRLGGSRYEPWLTHALNLSKEAALQCFAGEVARLLYEPTYIMGITRHLIEFCAAQGMADIAFASWNAAFKNIQHRLPSYETVGGPFLPYTPEETPIWSIDEGLLAVLLARVTHPELERKMTALAGLATLISSFPELVIAPLKEFFCRNTPITSTLSVLQVLNDSETSPYQISIALQGEFADLARCEIFGIRVLAKTLLQRIGIEPEIAPRRNSEFVAPPVSSSKQAAVVSLDWGERVERLVGIWPKFPALVASRFDQLWQGAKIHQERSQSRYQASSSSVIHKLPPTKMLKWEHELFESVFHEVLNSIEIQLWNEGKWISTAALEIAEQVLPRIKPQIARWHSRVIRPSLPLPSVQQSAVSPAVSISGEDTHNGWYRCGYYERELIFEDKVLGDLSQEVTVFAGIEIIKRQNFLERGSFPFGQGNSEKSWDWHDEEVLISPQGFAGPLLGLEWKQDFLGSCPILMLPPQLSIRCRLHPTQWTSRLELVDSQGESAVLFRWWSVRPVGDRLSEQAPISQGCDLIVRPDVFEQIGQFSIQAPIEVKLVQQEQV